MKKKNIDDNSKYSYAIGLHQATSFLVNRSDVVEELLIREDINDKLGTILLEEYAKEKNIKVRVLSKDEMSIIDKNKKHIVKIRKYKDIIDADKPHIVFEKSSIAGNIGNIIRTSVCLGIRDIALINPLFDPFDKECIITSMDCFAKAHIQIFNDINEYIKAYPEHKLYLFMIDANKTLDEVIRKKIPKKYSLVFGNEVNGLPSEYSKLGQSIVIPMQEDVDSINVVTAAGIGIYEFVNKSYNK